VPFRGLQDFFSSHGYSGNMVCQSAPSLKKDWDY
jgi:hypothetical protein